MARRLPGGVARANRRNARSKLLTHPLEGLERYDEMMRLLTTAQDAIKVFVNVSPE